jgi:hypothetical protein
VEFGDQLCQALGEIESTVDGGLNTLSKERTIGV